MPNLCTHRFSFVFLESSSQTVKVQAPYDLHQPCPTSHISSDTGRQAGSARTPSTKISALEQNSSSINETSNQNTKQKALSVLVTCLKPVMVSYLVKVTDSIRFLPKGKRAQLLQSPGPPTLGPML